MMKQRFLYAIYAINPNKPSNLQPYKVRPMAAIFRYLLFAFP